MNTIVHMPRVNDSFIPNIVVDESEVMDIAQALQGVIQLVSTIFSVLQI